MDDIKQKILDEIQKNVDVFHKVSSIRYKIRCPFCGDSQSDPKESHLYIKCDYDPTIPLVYYCFRGNCGARGVVGKDFLDKLGVKVDGVEKLVNQTFNKISYMKKTNVSIITGAPILGSLQIQYIERRLGKGFTVEDYDKFKIIWNMDSIIPYITDERVKNTLPSNLNSVSFLSEDKSVILTRFFWDEEPRWKKSKMFVFDNKSFYTIKAILDLFTTDRIVINIAEGIFDILSVYKNFNDGGSHVHIASLGADYESAIVYAINSGFIGSNVTIRIYIDSNIDEKILKNKIKKYNWIFGKMYIIKNIKYEDVGTVINNIKLIEHQV